jgi:hypothetical protein
MQYWHGLVPFFPIGGSRLLCIDLFKWFILCPLSIL